MSVSMCGAVCVCVHELFGYLLGLQKQDVCDSGGYNSVRVRVLLRGHPSLEPSATSCLLVSGHWSSELKQAPGD